MESSEHLGNVGQRNIPVDSHLNTRRLEKLNHDPTFSLSVFLGTEVPPPLGLWILPFCRHLQNKVVLLFTRMHDFVFLSAVINGCVLSA